MCEFFPPTCSRPALLRLALDSSTSLRLTASAAPGGASRSTGWDTRLSPKETTSSRHAAFCKKNGMTTPDGRWVKTANDRILGLDGCPSPTQDGKFCDVDPQFMAPEGEWPQPAAFSYARLTALRARSLPCAYIAACMHPGTNGGQRAGQQGESTTNRLVADLNGRFSCHQIIVQGAEEEPVFTALVSSVPCCTQLST